MIFLQFEAWVDLVGGVSGGGKGSDKPPKLKKVRHYDLLTWPHNARSSIGSQYLKLLFLKFCICPRKLILSCYQKCPSLIN